MREAESAIQMLNNFDMGSGLRLAVKVSETKEDRDKRLAKKKEEDEFLSTLNCGKYGAKEEQPVVKNGYELTDEEIKNCKTNPFLPSYKPRDPLPGSPQEPGGSQEDGGEHKGAGGFSLGGSGGALSMQAAYDNSKPTPPSNPAEAKKCTKCGKPCKLSCQRCKAPYCGKVCQSSDWKRHRGECCGSGAESDGGKKLAPPPQQTEAGSELVIREKEHSEDEGFDIPTPPMEELMEVLQQKPVCSTTTKPAEAPSPPATSKPPTSQHTEEEKAPLSLPIVGPSVQTQAAVNHSVSFPSSPSQPPPPPTDHSPSANPPHPSPVAVALGCKPISPSKVLSVFQSPGPPLPSLPLGCLPPKRFKAVVTSALTCSRFSVVIMSVEVKQALKSIAEYETTGELLPADPYNLVVGSKVGFFDDNGELYRMEVRRMHMSRDEMELRFYDFGGGIRTTYSRNSLVFLPEQVVTIPCLRYRCCLPNLHCKDFVGYEHLQNTVRSCAVQVTTLARQQTLTNCVFYVCRVQLPDGRELEPLMTHFLQTVPSSASATSGPPPSKLPGSGPPPSKLPGSGPKLPPVLRTPPPGSHSTPQPHKPRNLKLMYMAKDVSVRMVPSETDFMVVPQVVDSPFSIWGHVVHPQLGSLCRLQEDLKGEYGGREGQVYSPRVGELCVVKHCQDQQWYRAEVICVNNNGTADVRFVDYGQREMVLVSQVQHIEPGFLTLPLQAVHFSLVGVAPSGHALSWGDDAITYLKNRILNKKLTARLVSTSRQQVHSVTLCDESGRPIAQEMVNNGWCVKSSDGQKDTSAAKMAGVKMVQSPDSPKSPASSPPPLFSPSSFTQPAAPLSHNSSGRETLNQACENGPQSTDISPKTGAERAGGFASTATESFTDVKVAGISLPVNEDVEALVTSVHSPFQFHVQPLEKQALETLKEISEKLNSTTLAPFPPSGQFPMFCAARYAEDKMIHRARIWKQQGSNYLVRFIDYGNFENVAVSDVYILPASCAELPAQSVFCSLNGFKAAGQSSEQQVPVSQQCVQEFRSLIENRVVVITTKTVLETYHSRYPKHIVDMRDKSGKDALSCLVEAGHAKDERSSPRKQKKSDDGKRPGSGERKRGGGKGGSVGGNRKEGGRRSGGGGGGGWKKKEYENESSPSKPWGAEAAASPTKSSPFAGGRFGSREKDIQSENASPCKSWGAAKEETAVASPEEPPPLQETKGEIVVPDPAEPPPPDYTAVSTLAKTELPSDMEFIEVVITSVAELPNFYVHLATEQSNNVLAKLLEELNSGSLPPPPSCPLSEGDVVVCKYPVDNVWYRASVLGKQDDKFAVKFIDYGNEELVPLENIVPCPPELLKPPVLSVKCTLHGVYPPPPSYHWSPEAASFLQQYCERTLLARLESRDTISGVPSVHLVDSSSPEETSIAMEMVRAGLAAPTPPPMPKSPPTEPPPPPTTAPTSSVVKKEIPFVNHLPQLPLPREREFDVLVLSASSLTEAYLHPVSSKTHEYLTAFMTSISEYCFAQTTPPATPPPVGHYCLALFDVSWYRAKVESFDSANNKLGVFFVDYGNRETVWLTQIRTMPAQFTDVPMLVLKCGLYGIEPRSALEPDPAVLSAFGLLVAGSMFTCRVVSYQPLLVDLVDQSTSCSVRENLSLPPFPPTALFSVETSSLGEEGKAQVQVTEMHGASNFWVQSVESPDLHKLNPLMEEIYSHCSSVSPSHPPVLGELSCAKFSEDGAWYRARVISFPSSSQCKVRFLDYGNCEVCELSTVVPATKELFQLPTLAIHCTLEGAEEEEGGEGSGEWFKGMVENQLLLAQEKGWERGKTVVTLNGSNGPIHL